ncbi:Uncharacterized [Moorella glycerini]|uniref:CRISPR-associated protein n=1 Tax=Neomoorella stamsii TaxID=1266720 RepID=A0A9X7J121_9FIRM|nr:CRISPR-associated protein [Moorella stamsii]CEP66648.1 Uncharacterized [Moorella glycerini]
MIKGSLCQIPRRLQALRAHESLSLPRKFPLVVGYLILSILGDPLMERVNLKRVSEQSNIRNSTIFSHGFIFISENTYQRFRELVENLLVKFFEINGRNFADEAAKYEFVKIGCFGCGCAWGAVTPSFFQ